MKGNEDIVAFLIKKGARVRAANKIGEACFKQYQYKVNTNTL